MSASTAFWTLLSLAITLAVSFFIAYLTTPDPTVRTEFFYAGIACTLACAVIVVWPLKTQARRLKGLFHAWRPQWPLARVVKPPTPIPFATRFRHVRTYAYFDEIERNHRLRIVLVYFNGSEADVTIESVDGQLGYPSLGASVVAGSPVGWLDAGKQEVIRPFDEAQVSIVDHLGPERATALMSEFAEGKSVGIEFHLRVIAKAERSTFQLHTWQGVSCRIKKEPVVDGRLVFITGGAPVELIGTGVMR
jgi:hypothetical protein